MLIKVIRVILIIWCSLNGFGELKTALTSHIRSGADRFVDLMWFSCYILTILFLSGVLK